MKSALSGHVAGGLLSQWSNTLNDERIAMSVHYHKAVPVLRYIARRKTPTTKQCIHTYIHTHSYTYTLIHLHTHTHTHTHTYTHTRKRSPSYEHTLSKQKPRAH